MACRALRDRFRTQFHHDTSICPGFSASTSHAATTQCRRSGAMSNAHLLMNVPRNVRAVPHLIMQECPQCLHMSTLSNLEKLEQKT